MAICCADDAVVFTSEKLLFKLCDVITSTSVRPLTILGDLVMM